MRDGRPKILILLRGQLAGLFWALIKHFVSRAGTLVRQTTEPREIVHICSIYISEFLCLGEAILFESVDVRAILIQLCAISALFLYGIQHTPPTPTT